MQDIEIMQQCMEVGQEAYEQELRRQKAIVDKAEYLMKYHTLLIAILNLSLPLIIKYVDMKKSRSWLIFYVLAMAVLLLGIIFTLTIQKPRKLQLFPTTAGLLQEVQKNKEKYRSEEDWIYRKILLWNRVTVSLDEANELSVKWIKAAYVFFVLAIFLMGIFFSNIIFLSI